MRRLRLALLVLLGFAGSAEAQVITGAGAGPCATTNALARFTAVTTLGCGSVTDDGAGTLTGPTASNLALYAATGRNLLLGGNAGTQLTLDGTNVTLASGQLRLPDGTAGAPSILWTDVGLYRAVSGSLGVSLGLEVPINPETSQPYLRLGPSVGASWSGLGKLASGVIFISNAGFGETLAAVASLGLRTQSGYQYTWTSNTSPASTAADTGIKRLAATQVFPTDGSTGNGFWVQGAGTGAGTYIPLGAINVQTSAAGVGNGADATDDTLFAYSLPLNSLSANGKSLRVRAWGKTAANANGKTIKLWFAGATAVTSGAIGISNLDWHGEMEITRIDATHVSVIATYEDGAFANGVTTVTANLLVADLTANASIIKVTGASAASAANDVLGHGMKVWFEN